MTCCRRPQGDDELPLLTDEQAEAVRVYLATGYQVPGTLDSRKNDKLTDRAMRVSRDMFVGVAGTNVWARRGVITAARAARAYLTYKKARRGAAAVLERAKRRSGGLIRRIRNLPGIP